MTIKHKNILYIKDFSEIGGVETFNYEMAKKYRDLDIAIVCKTGHPKQIERAEKYCRVYIHTGQLIDCKVAIINYDVSIIDYIGSKIWKENADEDEGIYQVIHGDYSNTQYYEKPPTDNRIKEYIAVTKTICESFKKLMDLENVTYSYNPLSIENEEPRLKLISATRMSKAKGQERMIKLANALDSAHINYVWYVFTNSFDVIKNPNVVFMKSRLDVNKWIAESDYLIQLSDTEACSYSILEALYRNIPVIVTPLPYLEEIGVRNNENAYIMDFDCSNIKSIVDKIKNKPKFKYKRLQDGYKKILYKSKSNYEGGKKVKVKALATYQEKNIQDSTVRRIRCEGEIFEVSEERYKILSGDNEFKLKFVEPVIEIATKEVAKETTAKKTTKAKKNATK